MYCYSDYLIFDWNIYRILRWARFAQISGDPVQRPRRETERSFQLSKVPSNCFTSGNSYFLFKLDVKALGVYHVKITHDTLIFDNMTTKNKTNMGSFHQKGASTCSTYSTMSNGDLIL
jgi:hypothetical protein